MRCRCWVAAICSAVTFLANVELAKAQRAVDIRVGSWELSGANPMLYSAALWRNIWGPLGYSLRGSAVISPDSTAASLYGLGPELSLLRGSDNFAPYALAGVGLALRPGGSTGLVALWNAGLGVEFTPLSWLGLNLEAGYLVEDGGFRGFWNTKANDRRGWLVGAGLAFRWGGQPYRSAGRGGRARPPASVASRGAASAQVEPESGESLPGTMPATEGAAGSSALAVHVVQTALAAMGEPYRWGGTSTEEGFDCSGLVWYAYQKHGVSIPRTSRDQGQSGTAVAPNIAMLLPGDILLFSNRGGRVTHVGLYIGNAQFIHATTSGGVRVGLLDGTGDANDRWYRDRWVGARRVLR